MDTSTRHQAHISPDGHLHLDNEPQVVPEGVDPAQVVVQRFHIDAAGTGLPILVQVHDERTGSAFPMQVMPDGTTQAPGTTPSPPVQDVNPIAERLAAAQAAGRAHDFAGAIAAADDILQQLTATHGETGRETLWAAQFRADLAYLSAEYAFAAASWTWIALAWFDRLGPGMLLTEQAAQKATRSWMQLPPQAAAPSAPTCSTCCSK